MAEGLPLLHKQERRVLGEELRRRVTGETRSTTQFTIALTAAKPVDRVALARAFNAVATRHAALRTVIVPSPRYNETVRRMQLQTFARTGVYVPGLYEQRVRGEAPVELHERRWSGEDEELNAIAREESLNPLVSVAPMLRATLIASLRQQFIIINTSHLMLDWWAAVLLHREVAQAYDAFVTGTRWDVSPVLQQHELVAEELALLQSPEGDRHREYWSAHYGTLDDALIKASELPFVNRGAAVPKYEELRLGLSDDEATQVREACGREPDYAFWRAMYGIALGLLVNKTRVAFWANLLNRRRPGAHKALAWCAHPHLLSVEAPWSRRWTEVWQQVRGTVRQAQMHERYSRDSLLLTRGRPHSIGDTLLSFDVVPGHAPHVDSPLQPVSVPGGIALPVDLDVRVQYVNRRYTLVVTFNASRYNADGVRRLLTQFHDAICLCAAQPTGIVGDIVRDARQRQQQSNTVGSR